MNYLSVKDFAKKWNLSERTVRNYCANNKIRGAFLVGKTWNIPANSVKPTNVYYNSFSDNLLLNVLKEEKDMRLKGGIYNKIQVELAFNSNHIEGSTLTHEQTRFIFETNTIGISDNNVNVDDIIETTNHFKCVDFIIDNAKKTLNEDIIKMLHFILKSGTTDSNKQWFNVGDYKKLANEVGGMDTTNPKLVKNEIQKLLSYYNNKTNKTIEDIIEFHQKFESIHPFQDGNGRVGRLIMFKECLNNNIVPFIIDEAHKYYYYRGLKEWNNEKGFLIDTCLSCQDKFLTYLNYFNIKA